MRLSNTFSFSLIFLLLVPLQIDLGQVGTRSLTFVSSDLFIIISILVYLHLFSLQKIHFHKSSVLFCFYVLILYFLFSNLMAVTGDLAGSDLGFLGIAREYRSVLGFFGGVVLAYYISFEKLIRISIFIFTFMLLSLLMTDVYSLSNWPNVRWGGSFYGVNMFGFPNMLSIYYVFCSLFLLILYFRERAFHQLILALSFLLFALLSGSRVAFFSLLLVLPFTILMIGVLYRNSRVLVTSITLLFISLLILMYSLGLFDAIESKLVRMSSNGFFYGRSAIFDHVLGLIKERPVLGYGYAPLAFHYQDHSSVHNGYLYLFYKSGFIGFLLYFFSVFILVFDSIKLSSDYYSKIFILSVLLLLLLSSASQAILSYNVITTLLFSIYGFFFYKKKSVNLGSSHAEFN